MVRKLGVVALSLFVLASLVTGAAGAPRRQRVETATYTGGGINGLLGVGWGENNIGTIWFPTGNEPLISVEIADERGLAVWGRVIQDLNGDRDPDVVHDFCGSTDGAVKIQPRVQVAVVTYNGVCPVANAPSIPTTGTITGTFSFR